MVLVSGSGSHCWCCRSPGCSNGRRVVALSSPGNRDPAAPRGYANGRLRDWATLARRGPMNANPSGSEGSLERPPWVERRFAFGQPPWMLADIVERLRGLIPRLGPLLAGVDDGVAHRQHEGKWS